MLYNNSGPWNILGLLVTSCRQWRPDLGAAALTNVLAFLTILSQFSSTLLLSDCSLASIPSKFNTSVSVLGFVDDVWDVAYDRALPMVTDTYLSGLPSYPTFAEISYPEKAVKAAEIDDTGPSIRGFLPVPESGARSNLLSFRGNATIYDARVACVEPRLDNLVLGETGDLDSDFNLTGSARPVQNLGPMFVIDADQAAWFHCTLPWGNTTRDEWPVTLCRIHSAAGGFLSSIDPFYNTSLSYAADPDGGGWVFESPDISDSTFFGDIIPVGHAYLVLNITWKPITDADEVDIVNATKDPTAEKNGPWLRMTSQEPDSQLPSQVRGMRWSIDASLCYDAVYFTKNVYVEASRTHGSTEPATPHAGLQQLGLPAAALSTASSYEQRGILQLSNNELARQFEIEKDIIWNDQSSSDEGHEHSFFAAANPVSAALWIYRSLKQDDSSFSGQPAYAGLNVTRYLHLAPVFLDRYTLSVSEERAELFQQALRSTNSPAKALHALFHTVMTNGFYRHLSYYDIPSNYSASYEISALQPGRKIGLIIVLTALALHIVCVSIITIFLSGILSTGSPPLYESINNIWQAHAQLLNPEIESILRDPATTQQSDCEVKKRLKQENNEDPGKRSVFVLKPGVEDEDDAVRLQKKIKPQRVLADQQKESPPKDHKKGIRRYMRWDKKGD